MPKVEDTEEYHSLLMKMAADAENDLLIEDNGYDPGTANDIGYLDGYALDVRDYYVTEGIDETVVTEDEFGNPDEPTYSEVAINAVRDLPEENEGTTVSVPTRTKIIEYTVAVGDSAGSIAQKFGLSTTTVLSSNGLNGYSILSIGKVLKIPPVDGIIYTIKSGDNLNKLAAKYKSKAEEIAEVNGISSDDLAVGMEVVLPGGRLPPPPPPPKVTTKYASANTSYIQPSPDLLANTKFLWPAGVHRITQYFTRRHTGLDIAGPMRTPLYAAESGTVIYAGWNSGGYGNMVLIDHGGGLFTRYGHATQLLVSKGDTVKRGDTVALMGSTGRSTGPHIHFEVMVGSIRNRVNPLKYIQ